MIDINHLAVIVLAAGKGTRMNSTDKNKVAADIAGKPLILRSYENLISQGFKNLFFVVGFAKESVMNILNDHVRYVEQIEQMGTGHAVLTALKEIPANFNKILVVQGDDSAFYTDDILVKFLEAQSKRGYKVSLMTTEVENPTGLGRIIRDSQQKNHAIEIVEEKVATENQKKIKEINTGCWIFDRQFIDDNIGKIQKNLVSGEYYLTDILKIAVDQGLPVFAFCIPAKYFHGVNTPAELEEAKDKIFATV